MKKAIANSTIPISKATTLKRHHSDGCMTASADTHTELALFKAERALYCFVFHSNPRVED
jgi:hypothetical protein